MRVAAGLEPGRWPAERRSRVLAWVAFLLIAAYIAKFAVTRIEPVPGVSLSMRPLWLDLVSAGAVGAVLGGVGRISRLRWVPTVLIATAAGIIAAVAVVLGHRAAGFGPDAERDAAVIAGVAAVGGVIISRWRGRAPTVIELLVFEVIVAIGLTDLVILQSKAIRDLDLYLEAGSNFLAGAPVYLAAPLSHIPTNPVQLPFLYPPVTLPLLALLAELPHPVVAVAWEAACLGGAIAGLRLLGVGWRWVPLMLMCPPFFQGLYVGNVVLFGFLLLCLAVRAGSGLVVAPVLKLQYGVMALWLVRARRWRALVGGAAVLAVLAIVTLPLVGVRLWEQWLVGLEAFSRSQVLMPKLYFQALPRHVPYVVFIAASVTAAAVGFLSRGRLGLARLGVATLVASPTVFDHGFTLAIPALLWLSEPVLWLGLGFVSVQGGVGIWGAVTLAMFASTVPWLRHSGASGERLHPLGSGQVPWGDDMATRPAS